MTIHFIHFETYLLSNSFGIDSCRELLVGFHSFDGIVENLTLLEECRMSSMGFEKMKNLSIGFLLHLRVQTLEEHSLISP